jgi:5'-nucleotidase
MSSDLSRSLVIGISSRALFDMVEANAVFEGEGVEAYARYQHGRENQILGPGTGFRLVQAILALNDKVKGSRKAEVVITSRNSPATSTRLFNSIRHYGLDIQRACLTGGIPVARYLKPFCVDLYLSAYEDDVQDALQAGIAAAVIYGTPREEADPCEEIRIAFDGDNVLFGGESEEIYAKQGLPGFLAHEQKHEECALADGPFAKFLRTLAALQQDRSFDRPPVRTALITARSMPTHRRVLNTFLAWGINVDEAFFMGGVSKTAILESFRPHIFFDDQDAHCRPASSIVPTARVPAALETQRIDAAAQVDHTATIESSTDVPQTATPATTDPPGETVDTAPEREPGTIASGG